MNKPDKLPNIASLRPVRASSISLHKAFIGLDCLLSVYNNCIFKTSKLMARSQIELYMNDIDKDVDILINQLKLLGIKGSI